MMWLYEIYEASRCLCHTERLGLDHWISREGGLLLPRWSTLRTSWMTRSCRRPTTGAQNGICIMTTTITNVTTVSTISLLIMPYSVGLVPAHVTQIVRSPAENGSPWLSQVFHRWGCCVAFHQALLSLHSALGLRISGRRERISFQMDCLLHFLGSGESGNVRAPRSGTIWLRFFYAKGENEYWNGQHKDAQRWLPSPLWILSLT